MKRKLTIPALAIAATLGAALAASGESGPDVKKVRGMDRSMEHGMGGGMGRARGPGNAPWMGEAGMGFGMDMFTKADTDGDGKISPDEFKAALEARFKAADANGDGQISADEMVAAAEARREEMRKAREKEMADAMIDRRDTNHDGMLSLDEMTPGDPTARFLKRFDKDGDGFVSEDEIKSAMAGRGMGARHGRGPGGGHGMDDGDE